MKEKLTLTNDAIDCNYYQPVEGGIAFCGLSKKAANCDVCMYNPANDEEEPANENI